MPLTNDVAGAAPSPVIANPNELGQALYFQGIIPATSGASSAGGDIWAYSLAAAGGGYANTNFDTYEQNASQGPLLKSSGAQNDSVTFLVPLTAGTWTFWMLHLASTDRGIYTVSFDGVSIGTTFDGYNGSTTATRSRLAGITVAPTGAYTTVLIQMASKNASSSAYVGAIHSVGFTRTV